MSLTVANAIPFDFALESGIHELSDNRSPGERELRKIEDRFIDAWARMAGAFAMDSTMGRIHAVVYLSADAQHVESVSERLGLPAELVEMHLDTLTNWGLLHEAPGGFVAEQDPWTWFVRTVRARQGRELLPIRNAVEGVRDAARVLLRSSDSANMVRLRETVARIERFTAFVGDFAKLVDAFVTLGAAPLLKFASMATRFVPRRAAT